MPDSKDDIRRQLSELNDEIRQLGGDADELFAQTGGDADGAQDSEDVAAELNNAEETGAILDLLYAKRQRLHDALGS